MELLRKIARKNLVGLLIINEKYEVIHSNFRIKSFFGNTINENEKYFGNIFRCHNTEIHQESKTSIELENKCGSFKQCKNCEIRSKLANVFQNKSSFDTHLFSKTFIIDEKPTLKWFEMVFDRPPYTEANHVYLYIVDVSDIMNYGLNTETAELITEIGITKQRKKQIDTCSRVFATTGVTIKPVFINIDIINHTHLTNFHGNIGTEKLMLALISFLKSILYESLTIVRLQKNQIIIMVIDSCSSNHQEVIKKISDAHPTSFPLLNLCLKIVEFNEDLFDNTQNFTGREYNYYEEIYDRILENFNTYPFDRIITLAL